MIRKYEAVPGFRAVLAALFLMMTLAGPKTARAQQPETPQPQSQQQPDQQSSSQEPSEEIGPRHKAKTHDYSNWTFNVGGGGSLTNGTTTKFARGGGGVVAFGVARNYSKYFGLRIDLQWDNLPLRNSALQLAQAPGATDHVYSLMLDPIFNIPVSSKWGGYFLVGPSFYHRSGKLDSSTAVPGSACNPFWIWWGACSNNSIPLSGRFLSSSVNQWGENFGGGITYKITPKFEFYSEFRYLHGSHSGITTDLRPITIGLRW